MLGSRFMPTWNAIAAFSKSSYQNLSPGVLLLYLVVSSALERLLLVAARVRRQLQGSTNAAATNYFRLCTFGIIFSINY